MEKKLEELKKNLYDTITLNIACLYMNINGFEVMGFNRKAHRDQPLLNVSVYKENVKIIHKEYDISDKIKTGWFSKLKLCDYNIQVVDKIMKDLTPIVAISEWREQKLKKLGI